MAALNVLTHLLLTHLFLYFLCTDNSFIYLFPLLEMVVQLTAIRCMTLIHWSPKLQNLCLYLTRPYLPFLDICEYSALTYHTLCVYPKYPLVALSHRVWNIMWVRVRLLFTVLHDLLSKVQYTLNLKEWNSTWTSDYSDYSCVQWHSTLRWVTMSQS